MKTNKKRENNDVMLNCWLLKLKVLRDRLSGFDLLFRRRQQVVHKEKETRKKRRTKSNQMLGTKRDKESGKKKSNGYNFNRLPVFL
jgi:hypothetical protein